MNNQGTIYLLHFSKPFKHAQHYLGWSKSLKKRVEHHRNGTGNPLVRAAVKAGVEVTVIRTWQGDRHLERKLKNQKNARALCPICKEALRIRKVAQKRARRQASLSDNPIEDTTCKSRLPNYQTD